MANMKNPNVEALLRAHISLDKYTEFATHLFEVKGKNIQEDVVAEVYHRFQGVTQCLQRVMNVLFLIY